MKPETAVQEIKRIRLVDKKKQTQERVNKFKSLLVDEIEFIIKNNKPTKREAWDKVFARLKNWFFNVRENVDDPKFSTEAFNQTYYIIKEKIITKREKQI